MNILVSACLLGTNCKYNGGNNLNEAVVKLGEKHKLIPVCPEVAGGMKIPHEPSERQCGRVISKSGTDVTQFFVRGAEKVLETAFRNNCTVAVMKSKSPSCGNGKIYDGTFKDVLTDGDGIAVELLKKHGITVYSENETDKLLNTDF